MNSLTIFQFRNYPIKSTVFISIQKPPNLSTRGVGDGDVDLDRFSVVVHALVQVRLDVYGIAAQHEFLLNVRRRPIGH